MDPVKGLPVQSARWFGATDRGLVREMNQDALAAPGVEISEAQFWQGGGTWTLKEGPGLWAVADGLGGHEAGELASGYAVRLVRWEAEKNWAWRVSEFPELASASLLEIHQKITELGRGQVLPMGSTLTGVWVSPQGAWLFHTGDTRLWRLNPEPRLLTEDHNEAWGKPGNPRKNVLKSCLGGGMENPRIDIVPLEMAPNDVWLLVSDGLEDGLTQAAWVQITAQNHPDPETLVSALVAESKRNSSDNLTALAIQWFA
ncbi:MAG: serine/threonine-protein phosphatase [Spirochaetales bacterium]|nr:serine/threonine-protein phosphatase [Spirochaetales bacterium]